MTIDSTPPGALVHLNGEEVGRTPMTRDFTWYGDYDVIVRKDGYETLKTHALVKAPWWQWMPFDLVAEILPLPFKDRQHLSFALQPAATQPVDPQEMLRRADELQGQLQSRRATTRPAQ